MVSLLITGLQTQTGVIIFKIVRKFIPANVSFIAE